MWPTIHSLYCRLVHITFLNASAPIMLGMAPFSAHRLIFTILWWFKSYQVFYLFGVYTSIVTSINSIMPSVVHWHHIVGKKHAKFMDFTGTTWSLPYLNDSTLTVCFPLTERNSLAAYNEDKKYYPLLTR